MSGTPDLFAGVPPVKHSSTARRSEPLELRAARALCRRIKGTAAQPDKKRIGHLICENLVALCKKSQRGAR